MRAASPTFPGTTASGWPGRKGLPVISLSTAPVSNGRARSISSPKPLYSDAGSLWWEGDVLVEQGRDIAYVEHWHRDGSATLPIAAVALHDPVQGRKGALLRVGPVFMFARDRAVVPPAHQTLGECVAGADSLEDVRALIDCEISFGRVGPEGFRITASSLPYRIGDVLGPRLVGSTLSTRDRGGHGETAVRHWEITESEGELGTLDAAVPALAER